MKFIASVSLLLIGVLSQLNAQITVTVIDSATEIPIPFVQAYAVSNQKGFVADSNGVIHFAALPDETEIIIRALGYQEKRVFRIQLDTMSKITLAPRAFQLKEVAIKPKTAKDFVITAVETAPYYFARDAVNSTLNVHERILFNGNIYQESKSIVKGYFIPLVDSFPDTSRVLIKAYKGVTGDTSMRNKQFKKPMANEVHNGMMELLDFLQQQGSPYAVWDSGFVRMFINRPQYIDDYKYKFESFDTTGVNNDVTIRAYESMFPSRSPGSALIRMNYKTMQINHAVFTYKFRGAKATAIKSALFLLGYKLKDLAMKTTVNLKELPSGYVPQAIDLELILHVENIHLFRKNDVYHVVSKQHYKVTEIALPATDQCTEGLAMPKDIHISKFMTSDYQPELITF